MSLRSTQSVAEGLVLAAGFRIADDFRSHLKDAKYNGCLDGVSHSFDVLDKRTSILRVGRSSSTAVTPSETFCVMISMMWM